MFLHLQLSSKMAGQATQETEEQYANEGSLFMMQVFFIYLFIYIMLFIFCLN